jgi:hypothetical protein
VKRYADAPHPLPRMALPWTWGVVPSRRTPSLALKAMMLPAPAPVPPTVLLDA